VGEDAGHGVAAAVVVAEHLGEEPPDGRDRAEHPVPVLDPVLVEDAPDARLGQDIGKREALVPREAGADRVQAGHRIGCGVSGRGERPQGGGTQGGRLQEPQPILRGSCRRRKRLC
jgi:hypothetical protein